jgi:hypothetical protein
VVVMLAWGGEHEKTDLCAWGGAPQVGAKPCMAYWEDKSTDSPRFRTK